MRPFAFALTLALAAGASTDASAQCCGTPTVAYSPVVAAPAPVVTQTVVRDGWYPGKAIVNFTRNLFGGNQTTTYTTNYAPYTAGYAPYTAGYAPTYSVGYAPTYTAGYAPTYQTAYRPTYPATWGQVSCSPVVQTVSRPVVLSPVVAAPACDACGGCGACNACSGVSQAAYIDSSSSCSSCSGGSSYVAPASGYSDYSGTYEPQPSLAPDANVPAERSIQSQRPEVDDTFDDLESDDVAPPADSASSEYWKAPPLFQPPSNRVTQNPHPAPVQLAVYHRQGESRQTSFRPTSDERPTGKVHRLSADGWNSAD